MQCQKLLFSATLTRDPSKIAALHLKNPRYFIVGAGDSEMQDAETVPADVTGNSFALPSTLTVGISGHILGDTESSFLLGTHDHPALGVQTPQLALPAT